MDVQTSKQFEQWQDEPVILAAWRRRGETGLAAAYDAMADRACELGADRLAAAWREEARRYREGGEGGPR